MVKHFTIEEILALNPQINSEDLEKIQKFLNMMYTGKRIKHRYSLIPPFARPRVTIGEDDKTDSRTIILRQTQR